MKSQRRPRRAHHSTRRPAPADWNEYRMQNRCAPLLLLRRRRQRKRPPPQTTCRPPGPEVSARHLSLFRAPPPQTRLTRGDILLRLFRTAHSCATQYWLGEPIEAAGGAPLASTLLRAGQFWPETDHSAARCRPVVCLPTRARARARVTGETYFGAKLRRSLGAVRVDRLAPRCARVDWAASERIGLEPIRSVPFRAEQNRSDPIRSCRSRSANRAQRAALFVTRARKQGPRRAN